MQSPPKLRHPVAANRILLVDTEHAVLVGIERDRLAVPLQIGPRRLEIIERRLRLHELQMHQPARRVVDVDQQRALRSARLEPPMVRAVDLDQFANAIPTVALLSAISSHSMSPGSTKSSSLSFTRCSLTMWPIERMVVPPTLRTRSAG